MHTAKLTELLQDAPAKLRKGVLARQEGEGGGGGTSKSRKKGKKAGGVAKRKVKAKAPSGGGTSFMKASALMSMQ